jgi:XTP/dITP diphosphohydrolase
MRKLLIGTHNAGKTREIVAYLAGTPFEVISLKALPNITPVDETGATLEENAILKARSYAALSGWLTLADDTGLEVAALNGAPGVYSARFAGENCTYDNNRLLISKLNGVPEAKRAARFRTVMALFDPDNQKTELAEGFLDGLITETMRGQNGFGYDPVFFIPALNRTLAELSIDEKNALSHRAQALQKAKSLLIKM